VSRQQCISRFAETLCLEDQQPPAHDFHNNFLQNALCSSENRREMVLDLQSGSGKNRALILRKTILMIVNSINP
jgi:hypothetical protein